MTLGPAGAAGVLAAQHTTVPSLWDGGAAAGDGGSSLVVRDLHPPAFECFARGNLLPTSQESPGVLYNQTLDNNKTADISFLLQNQPVTACGINNKNFLALEGRDGSVSGDGGGCGDASH